MLRRGLLLFVPLVVLLSLAAPAMAQDGGPDLPPTPDSVPAPAPAPDPVPPVAQPAPAPAPAPVPRPVPRRAPSAPPPAVAPAAPAGPSAADRARQRREAAQRRARERRAEIARERRPRAAVIARQRRAVDNAVAAGTTSVTGQVDNVVQAVRAEPVPAAGVGRAPEEGGATVTVAILALLGAAGIGALAFVRRRTGGRRMSPRLALSGVSVIDRRQVGVVIAAAFVIGAAAAAAVLAYLIVNPSAVG
jgi:hypothetical protein